MRIISKYKDYYDYLQGIYGVDEKLIIDRTKFILTDPSPLNGIVKLYICGLEYQCLVVDKKYYWGDNLLKFEHTDASPSRWYLRWINRKYSRKEETYYNIKYKNFIGEDVYASINKLPDATVYNDEFNCPILIQSDKGVFTAVNGMKLGMFPILKDYGFHQIMSAETIWIILSNWLSRTKDIPNTQTNTNKILAAGFDLKSSFRNVK